MEYNELITELKNKYRAYKATDNERAGRIFLEAVDAIEKLKQENKFLKLMQQQLVEGKSNNELGYMVSNTLKFIKKTED